MHAFVAAYLGPARLNATDAARRVGYAHPNKQGPKLLVNVGIQAEIQRWRDEVKGVAIGDMDYRLAVLDDLERRYRELIEARADEHAGDVPGGETGLLVKKVSVSPGGTETTEWAADTAVTKEVRELHKQAAQEKGQWKERSEHDATDSFLAALRAFGHADAGT